MTLASKANLPHAINFRALCGANLQVLCKLVGGLAGKTIVKHDPYCFLSVQV
jgi:hypothetical protein